MSEEIKFDHFKSIDELLEHIDIWYKEDDIDYTRWFGLTDLYQLGKYITDLRQKNKKLKQILYDIEKEYDEKSLFAEDSILTELEEWLKEQWYEIEPKGTGINFNCEYDSEEDYVRGMETKSKLDTLKNVLNKIQELKEKYK